MEATTAARGALAFRVIRAKGPGLRWKLSNTLRWEFLRGWFAFHVAPLLGRLIGFATVTSSLDVRVRKADGTWINYGTVGYRVVTTVGVNAMATAFITPGSPGTFYYHALGTTNTAPAVGDTAMAAEISTQYNPDNTRATGTHVQGASANIYQSVATNTVDGTVAAVECGILTQAATGGGSLLDRFIFSVVNLSSGDGFQSTFNLTFTAGG
jgi:hypothetical protein